MRSIFWCLLFLVLTLNSAQAQNISGVVRYDKQPLPNVNVHLSPSKLGAVSDQKGQFKISEIPLGSYTLSVSSIGFVPIKKAVNITANAKLDLDFEMFLDQSELDEVVVSGTMKEVSKLESPVPVEVYSAKFFQANPTPTIFDALQNVNGVRPQINCNVCNTGDIHINGLEGPYAMVLIDGMPIVSGLSTVYGLSGIPQALIERVEIVKGPASTLYGSEAVGGIINIITKTMEHTPVFSADVSINSWLETNVDVASKNWVGKNAQTLMGVNYFNYQNPIDQNNDGFTDLTLQHRISLFNKWQFERKSKKKFSVAGRYIYEDRWGGEMNWTKENRGGTDVYGESIFTNRWELFGNYELPTKENLTLSFSANGHQQNSVYGDVVFLAHQRIGFTQLTWQKATGNHEWLTGVAMRYTFYDDNTVVTLKNTEGNKVVNAPSHTYLPGVFVQDQINLNATNKVLLGLRYDYNSLHGSILTPRLNYKWNSNNKKNTLRLSFGGGYRVANIFTEDHAALTGAREVVFLEEINPEKSWNVNLNYVKHIYAGHGIFINLDATAFYTYFNNKIIADYDQDPNKIIYQNLEGYAVSKGFSLNADVDFSWGLNITAGATLMDVYSVEAAEKTRPLFTEKMNAVWRVEYNFKKFPLKLNYTGNLYSPMRLPLLSELDPRQEYSPWWSIQNVQATYVFNNGVEIYTGVKNILNWTPNKGNPFIIARANDPFDKNVTFNAEGQAITTAQNPYGLTFDPTYVYAPNQGLRVFVGMRYAFF